MKEDEELTYGEWISRRQAVPVPEGFAERVMNEIAKQPAAGRLDSPAVYRLLYSRPVQWAAALGALLLGLFRLSYIAAALLVP